MTTVENIERSIGHIAHLINQLNQHSGEEKVIKDEIIISFLRKAGILPVQTGSDDPIKLYKDGYLQENKLRHLDGSIQTDYVKVLSSFFSRIELVVVSIFNYFIMC